MQDSLFTKIIRGKIPSHKVYEDEKTFAFLDIYPVQEGHLLVIPKKQVEFLWDLEEEDYQAVMATAKKLAIHLRNVLNVPYVGEKVVGTDVPHAHVHLIPFYESHQLHASQNFEAEPDHDLLAELAKKISL
jgi:histidine triad (HIT) family protein